MIIKKLLALLFAVLALLNCPISGQTTVPVTVQGEIFSGKAGEDVSLSLVFDTGWITLASDKVYNPRLAAFSALLCADSYFRSKDVAKGTQNRVLINGEEDAYTQSALLEKLGYEDVQFIETFKQKQYAADNNDSATILLGYKNVDDRFDSYIIVLRGCFSAGERLSIFDVGASCDAYTAITGRHDEWTDTASFKGVDVAANRAMEFINEYRAQHDSKERPDTALITGHSRGAALANVIGAEFEKDRSVKSYTYTFNCMPVTANKSARCFRTVYNIFDVNDYYVNPLPFGKESFYRYGKDIKTNIAENPALKEKIAEYKGRDDYSCLSPEIKAEYDSLFASRFPDRDSLYAFCTQTQVFESLQAAEAKRSEFESLIGSAGLNIAPYCEISEIGQKDGEYSFTLSYCPQALIFCYAEIQAYGQAVYDAMATLFHNDEDGCRIGKIVLDNLSSINAGHLLINGYVAVR